MKKIFILAAVSASLYACETSTTNSGKTTSDSLQNTTTNAANNSAYTPAEGDLSYRGGQVYVWQNGTWVRSDADVKLEDGTTVRSNGRVSRDGDEIELEDGAVVTKTGRFFDKAGNVVEDGWEGLKKGYKEARDGAKKGIKKAGEEVKDVLSDDKKN